MRNAAKFHFLALFLILTLLAVPVSSVSAGLRTCNTDPKLTFSDGTGLIIASTIATIDSDVLQVLYTVHGPTGLALSKVVYTAAGLGGRESVVFVADQPAGVYQIDTFVTTGTQGVSVTTTTTLNSGATRSASGTSGSHIVISYSSPTVSPLGATTVSIKPLISTARLISTTSQK